MPFGDKPDRSGRTIRFNDVYAQLIAPAIEDAGLRPVRSDQEEQGGIIHKQMFERLLLCPYAVADLSTANANVFYEIGVRHAVREHRTVLVFSDESDLQFDVGLLRSMRYGLDATGSLSQVEVDRAALSDKLRAAQQAVRDSPIFELFADDYRPPQLPHAVTDTFHEQVQYAEAAKARLAELRDAYADAKRAEDPEAGAEVCAALREFEGELHGYRSLDAATRIGILLTWRACDGHEDMVRVVEAMPEHVRSQKVVQEQYGFALNRLRQRTRAQRVLQDVMRRFGPNPETNGLLGRVFKDTWQDHVLAGRASEAEEALELAIDTYRRGFDADIRDFYPGVNAVTLMEIAGDPRRELLLPVVRYAVERHIRYQPEEQQDYWEHATLLELAAIAGDREAAVAARKLARRYRKEAWEGETTAKNLRVLAHRRLQTGDDAVSEWILAEADHIER